MADNSKRILRIKIWSAFIILFICGAFVGVGIANWNHHIAVKKAASNEIIVQENLTSCQAVEKVLLSRLWNDDTNCDATRENLEVYKKLVNYGCPENRDRYVQVAQNMNAVLSVACDGWVARKDVVPVETKPCEQIELNLQGRLGDNEVYMNAEQRIERAKIYAVMAEKGCPENAQKYTEFARKELEIARGISDDKFNEEETIEAVETYKRLKMQQDAQEILDKAKKIANPAIDFIMQVEKIINE